MKEIDFIPEWYKASQKRRQGYHRQYVLLASLFGLMIGWSFIMGRHVQDVSADVEGILSVVEKGRAQVDEGSHLEAEIALLQQKADILERAASRTRTTAVIAELSHLAGDNVILSRLKLQDEVIEDKNKKQTSSVSPLAVQVGGSKPATEAVLKQMRTCVTLTGIAAAPADAARLISELEQSPYFEQESLVYSRPKMVQKHDVTEFEIRCYVADYQIRNQ